MSDCPLCDALKNEVHLQEFEGFTILKTKNMKDRKSEQLLTTVFSTGYFETCPACGWTRDENGQCHNIDCPWVDGDFDLLNKRMPEEDWKE